MMRKKMKKGVRSQHEALKKKKEKKKKKKEKDRAILGV